MTKGNFEVNNSSIGIKLGDGSFYPVLEENFKGKKRFVLSTVRDDQESMQIDFYRGTENNIETSEYIGSLVIDNITPAQKGVPEIEVIVGLDADNKLDAVAKNLASSEKQSLSVSLESHPEESAYTVPDFELDEKLQPKDLFKEDEDFTDIEAPEDDDFTLGEEEKEEIPAKKPNPLFALLFVLGGLVVVAGLGVLAWWIISTYFPQGNVVISSGSSVAAATPQVTQAPTPEPKDKSVVSAVKTAVPQDKTQAAVKTPEPKKQGADTSATPGVFYLVRSGDTLWDLAATYYRDPFQWYRIYRHKPNKIKDPDLIFVNQKVFIPEK